VTRYSKEETIQLRNRIIEATELMIREHGATQMTMRALAKKANVSPTTPYNLFGSKRQLLIDVIVKDFLTDVIELQLITSPSDSLLEVFSHIDKIESAMMAKETFVKELISGIIQSSPELDTQPLLLLMQGIADGWIKQQITDKTLAQQTNATFVSQQIAASVAGSLFLWASNSIASSELKWRLKYVIASDIYIHATAKHRPIIRKILKDIIAH